jgi:GntR family histidine utilization transcriptional repressor
VKAPPLSERIRVDIEARILSGEWPPGHRVPGEAELAAQYHCARMTANKALSALAHAGLVERRRRAGTFVARPRSQSMVLEIADLAAEVTARGDVYLWRLTSRKLARSDALGEGGEVLEIEGVHLANGVPLAFERRLVKVAEVPAIAAADLAQVAPGTWLLAHAPWTEAENRISAQAAPPEVAKALGLPKASPCLTVERRTWRGDAPVTLVRQYYVAGAWEFVARFGAKG